MRWGGFLFLAALFAVLATLWLRRDEAVRQDRLHVYDHPLLPDLEPESVTTVRIDHLTRDYQMRLERDGSHSWFLTDPIAYPAEDGLVAKLIGILARERGLLDLRPEPAELGLAPPRAVIELEERRRDGTTGKHRIEVGADDVDPLRVNVRVPGHPAAPEGQAGAVLRVSRAVANTLERYPDDFRDARITPFLGAEVRRFARTGSVDGRDLALDAVQSDGVWRLRGASPIRLDPGSIGLLARIAAELRTTRFVDDDPDAAERLGFDRPTFTVEITARDGQSVTLHFLARPDGRWLAMRADLPNVFEPERTDVGVLLRPAATLYDQTVLRVVRARVQRVTLERAVGRLVLARDGDGWRAEVEGGRFPADPARVGDLLTALESARVAAFVPGASFPDGGEVASFRIETDGGALFSGSVGPPWSDASRGVSGRLFRRADEPVVGLVDEALLAALETPLDELRPKRVHLLTQRTVDRVTLRRGADEQVYVRLGVDWRPHGLALDAPQAFLDLLDPLLALRVEDWLQPDTGGALDPAVEVELRGSFGAPVRFTLGRFEDGSAGCVLAGGSRALVRDALVRDVLALFESS